MIQRILVPKDARPLAAPSDAPPRRLTSELDARTLVPSNLPHIELDPRTSIPSHIPLGVLGTRTVVPRDMPNTPLDAISKTPDYVPLTILDSRVAVPKDAHASKLEPKQLVAIQDLPDVIDPDVLTTGEVNLMAQPVEERTSAWNAVARFASIAFHFVVILLILFGPRAFPSAGTTQAEIARHNITDLYLPNDVRNVPKVPAPPQPKSPVMRVDPRLLRQLAPPRELQPTPGPPEPERVVRDNPKSAPSAPMPQPRTQPPQDSPIKPPQTPPDAPSSLVLPRFSPGKGLAGKSASGAEGWRNRERPVWRAGGLSWRRRNGQRGWRRAGISRRERGNAHAHRRRGLHQLHCPRARQCKAELVRGDAGIGAPGRSGQSRPAISHHAQRRSARCGARHGRQFGKRSAGPRRAFLDSRFDPVRTAAACFQRPRISSLGSFSCIISP